jgi:hypothetical protein
VFSPDYMLKYIFLCYSVIILSHFTQYNHQPTRSATQQSRAVVLYSEAEAYQCSASLAAVASSVVEPEPEP